MAIQHLTLIARGAPHSTTGPRWREYEFELRERAAIMDRKIDLIARTASTVLDLLQKRRSIRVEWYIVILIVLEITLSVYGLFLAR